MGKVGLMAKKKVLHTSKFISSLRIGRADLFWAAAQQSHGERKAMLRDDINNDVIQICGFF